jgi:D-alanyl-lipoteichoic acid acyltransferase DltB (MBOAT superfamily)
LSHLIRLNKVISQSKIQEPLVSMVFASLLFLFIFLPLNLILYYLHRNSLYRNIILTLFSFVFYAWGEPVWVLLLIFSSLVDYGNAIFIEKYRGSKWAKLGVVSTVIFNAGILVAFKYGAFIYGNLNALFDLHLTAPTFSLPVGISFYTFQTLSYVIDVYRGDVKAQRSPLKFMMFVSLYHQLVAGPIVRYSHIMHEIDNRKFNIGDISSGIIRFSIGLFKKVCISNVAAEMVDKYMKGEISGNSTAEAWFGAILFSLHIYFDFSAYSDMAIGLGRMFGFHYHENFKYPYVAKSATEFWRRWHISLGTFFRDYIYIPMGGNRGYSKATWILSGILLSISTSVCLYLGFHNGNWQPFGIELLVLLLLFLPAILRMETRENGKKKIVWGGNEMKIAIAGVINLFFVWFFTGLWHGDSWNYILWGLYFGLLIYIERLFLMKILKKVPSFFSHIYLLFAAILGWVLFYFEDTTKLWKYLGMMFGKGTNENWNFELQLKMQENMFWLVIALLLCLPIYPWLDKMFKRKLAKNKQAYLLIGSVVFGYALLIVATSMLVGKSYNPFIYYRF